MQRQPLSFPNGGSRCAGDLFLPEGSGPFPLVLLAHGIAAQRAYGLAPFVERFVEAGLAALIFDYRHFGDSEGEPRERIDPQRHIEDIHAAIDFAKGLEAIDPTRVALWGTSFGGGHSLMVASRRSDLRAVVAQVPFVDGLSTLRMMSLAYMMSANLHAMKALHPIPQRRYVPVVAQPGRFALMNTPESFPGYSSLVPEEERDRWPNRAHASILLKMPFYRPISVASKITCPVLLVYAERDSLIDPNAVRRTAERIADCETLGLDVGHFEVYRGDPFEKVVERETEFLLRRLGGPL